MASTHLFIPGRAERSRCRAAVPLLMAVSLVCYANRVSIATAGDARIMGQYGLAPTRMGMVYSAFLLMYTLGMIPGGYFIDRFRPRSALLAVLAGSAVFVALTGVVGLTVRDGGTAFAVLLVVRGLMGFTSAPLYPACAAAVGDWVGPGRRSRCNGLVTGSALVGVAATPGAFGALIDRVDWPGAFLVAAAVTAALAVVWWVAAPGSLAVSVREEPGPTPGRVSRDVQGAGAGIGAGTRSGTGTGTGSLGSLVCLTLSYGAVGYFQYLFFYWMAYYFERVLELPTAVSRGYAAVPPLAMAVGMPLGGWLSDRLEREFGNRSRWVVPMAGMALGGLLLSVGLFASDLRWIVAWFALALGAVGMVEGPFWVTAVELGGRRGGRSAAVLNTGGNAGGMLAPVVTPWVGQAYGWAWGVGLGALVCFAGVLLWLGIDTERVVDGPEGRSSTGV